MSEVPVVFCADRRVLPGLHVAAASVLSHVGAGVPVDFHVISNDLSCSDIQLLDETLSALGRPFRLSQVRVDPVLFRSFPTMRGSLGNYFRLLIHSLVDHPRSVYMDVDTLCLADVRELLEWDLGGHPAGFVAEGSIASTADASVRRLVSTLHDRPYLNSGVMVMDHAAWSEAKVTERCIELLHEEAVDRHEQTALNVVLADGWAKLDARFNLPTNRRPAWPDLARPGGPSGSILHFLDYPKPWDFLAEWVHPHYRIWRETLDRTAMRSFRSWHGTPVRRFPRTPQAFRGYRQAAKDRLLFGALKRGWIAEVKGMNSLPSA